MYRGVIISLILLVIVLLLLFGSVVVYQQMQLTARPSPTPLPSLAIVTELPSPSPSPIVWQTYTNSTLGFSLQHPPGLTIRETPTSVAFNLWGATQARDTELFDGLNVIIEKITFPRGVTSLEALAEAELTEAMQQAKVITPLQPVRVGVLDGFTYTIEGVGRFTTLLVPHSPRMALQLTYSAPDPTGQNYQRIVDQMVSSLQLTTPSSPTPSPSVSPRPSL